MNQSSLRTSLELLLCAGALILGHSAHTRLDLALNRTGLDAGTSSYHLPSPRSVQILSLGFDQVLADLYWLAFIQYIGNGKERNIDHYVEAEKYIDLITCLDPKFVPAYYFAAFTIGSEQHSPDVAAQLIDRGIEVNQDSWYLPFIAGINQYLYAHNEVKAAKYYRMAAKFPDAPKWLGRQAEILEAKIPSTIKEVNVWDSIYSSSKDSTVKERARMKLASLWLRVYKTSPSKEIKKKALEQLHKIGIEDPTG